MKRILVGALAVFALAAPADALARNFCALRDVERLATEVQAAHLHTEVGTVRLPATPRARDPLAQLGRTHGLWSRNRDCQHGLPGAGPIQAPQAPVLRVRRLRLHASVRHHLFPLWRADPVAEYEAASVTLGVALVRDEHPLPCTSSKMSGSSRGSSSLSLRCEPSTYVRGTIGSNISGSYGPA
jgi:hypothetical protein